MGTRGARRQVAIALVAGLLAASLSGAVASPRVARAAAVCSAEVEPNNSEAQVQPFTAPGCVAGTLPQGDQDLFLWDVPATTPESRWTISLTGVVGTVTALKILTITSDPGVTPIVAGSQIFQVSSSPVNLGPVQATDVMLAPARYLVGLTRTGTVDGGEPVSLDYQFDISAADPLPPTKDHEPNNDPSHSAAVNGAFSVSGDLQGSEDYLAWNLSATDAKRRWQLSFQTNVGAAAQVILLNPSGQELTRISIGEDGRGTLHDLALPAGKIDLDVSGNSSISLPYVVTAAPEAGPPGDPEPNDNAQLAVPLQPGHLVATGRLSQPGDRDNFRFHVDDKLAAVLLDIKLIWQMGPERSLCLSDAVTNAPLGCRETAGGDTLPNLFLPIGDYTLEVRGDANLDDPYLLRIDATVAPAPDFETEPNDDPTTATPWTAGVVMRGRGSTGDTDYFKVNVSGPPQLWELDVTGTEINALRWYRRDGTSLADGEVTSDHLRASLGDMYLVPGDHWIRVDAIGDYELTIKPLGPPDPNGEREPNNSSVDAQPLAIGVPRTGRLALNNDLDVSRFSLQAAERLHLSLTPPPDGSVAWRIYSGGTTIAGTRTADVGVPISQDLALPAGDYELWLEPGTISTGHYTVELDREDPFEPAPPLPASVSLSLATSQVAAYWSSGQRVTGQVLITNTGAAEETLDLDSRTSHYAWSATLAQDQVTLAPGASTSVAVNLDVQPDAWSNVPVRLTVRARDASGDQSTAFAEVTPGPNVQPVAPRQAWSVPDALLGGLDVASTALGGQPVPAYDPDQEAQLYDGYTPAGGGFATSFSALPVTLTTDLAGDAPVPVAGIILNPQAHDADQSEAPKDIELWLSEDGASWSQALTAEMSPLPIDQSFVLPAAVPAKYAQLRITSLYAGDSTRVALGEFKVIAAPGTAPASTPINVADPGVGGHIVWMDPQSEDEDVPPSLLSEDPGARWIYAKANVRPQWVLGFWNDRAAQLTQLQWVDPTGSDPSVRFNRVDIATSMDGPLGPWTNQGTWTLKRSADGTVAPFAFAAPTWARYVRYAADALKVDSNREQPGVLRAIESPTGADYRSVFAEYGDTPAGDYEVHNPPPDTPPSYGPDGNDTPATASPLAPDVTATGTAHAGQDVDWYDVTVPDGQNTLAFTVAGSPSVGVSLVLQDQAGGSVPMKLGPGDEPGTVLYTASVTPGTHYHVEVQQPPFSAVFTYDTSGSVANYLDYVFEAERSFSGAVVPGRQAVQIVPFEEQPLLPEWSDDPYALQDAVEGETETGGSSSAETALIDATRLLASREGAKAILLVTDAETSSFARATEMWQALGGVRPQVFAVQVGASSTIARSGDYMRDWAASSGGFYQYTQTHGEMDRAFDRMATWLERPTAYAFSYRASFVKPPDTNGPPGSLRVVGANAGDPSHVPVAGNVAIELVLDTSGSMLDRLEGRSRIAVAQSVLTRLVRDKLPAGVPLAMRVFGDTPSSCDTRLAVPLGPLNPGQVIGQIDGIHILSSVNTPIGGALKQVASDLKGVTGPRIVVLMTDGQENCGGNPGAAVKALAKAGFDIHVNIVGFQIGQKSLRTQLAGWAKLGHGSFFNATGTADLTAALAQAVSAPYQVTDAKGTVVATGTVNGAPIPLKPGTYHVTVLTDPTVEFDAVVVASKQPVVLTLPGNP